MANEKIDIDKVMSLTTDEIVLISKLGPIAEKAKKFADMICDKYYFRIGQEFIGVSDSGDEFLTRDGVWEKSISGQSGQEQTVQITCTYEEIFKVLRDDYLRQNGLLENAKPNEEIATSFLDFLARTQDSCEGKNNDRPKETIVTVCVAEEDLKGTQTQPEIEQKKIEEKGYILPNSRVKSKPLDSSQTRSASVAESVETTEEQEVTEQTSTEYWSFTILQGAANKPKDEKPGGINESLPETGTRF